MQCNHAKCKTFFFVNPFEKPGEFGFLCPECDAKSFTFHVVQCTSCKTVINFVGALEREEKVVFVLDKCSHCIGSIDDERNIEPVYHAESLM